MTTRHRRAKLVLVTLCLMLALTPGATAQPAPAEPGEVVIGKLVYGDGQTAVCFSEAFLDAVARQTPINIDRDLALVRLGQPELADHPMVVMSGEGAFELDGSQVAAMRSYLDSGGTLIASAGCSSRAWAESFRELVQQMYGPDAMQPIETDHPVYSTLFQVDRLQTRRANHQAQLWTVEQGGTTRIIFSPAGLNDTDNAGGGCCCCGGSEIRNAREVMANLVVYVLTH
jgi:hypothetical protein